LKAIFLKEFGGPEVLRLEDFPTPQPAAGNIVLKVHSVSVNRTLDLIVRAGKYPVKIRLPHVLGADPGGEVVEIGGGVTEFKVGDRVAVISATPCQRCDPCLAGKEANCAESKRIGVDLWGGYAEFIALPARYAVKLPDEISFAEGTVITRHFPMAFNLLAGKADIKPGEWVWSWAQPAPWAVPAFRSPRCSAPASSPAPGPMKDWKRPKNMARISGSITVDKIWPKR
jgi:NADPH:quinone reductase